MNPIEIGDLVWYSNKFEKKPFQVLVVDMVPCHENFKNFGWSRVKILHDTKVYNVYRRFLSHNIDTCKKDPNELMAQAAVRF